MLSVATVFAFSACSNSGFGKKKLCDSLEKDYVATVDFIISSGEKSTSGKANITKENTIELVFTEPEIYKEISVICDETGSADTYSFEYCGIPANVPKSIVAELSILFSLFSDDVTARISDLSKDSFSRINENENEVFFDNNGQKMRINYSSKTGVPSLFESEKDGISISVRVLDFDPIE